MLSFKWSRDGVLAYTENENKEDMELVVPMPDGSQVLIEHLFVDTAKETVGVFSCPSGKAEVHIKVMQKIQGWIDWAKEEKLRRQNIWFLLEHQLWPKVGYGISSLSAPWKELNGCLCNKWWQIVPMGGLIRTAPAAVRHTDAGFYGTGCPHVGVECFVQQVNKLLMHYRCSSNTGFSMKVLLEYMVVELGISGQPFQETCGRYEKCVTHSWLKSVWEKCNMFGVLVDFGDVSIEFPRVRDHWLMGILTQLGYSKAE